MEEITFSEQQEMRAIRMAKVEDMRKSGVNPYAYSWRVTHRGEDLVNGWDNLKPGEEDINSDVSVAGRIIARRGFGKLAFFILQDGQNGLIQLYLDQSRLGKDEFKSLNNWTDVGDVVGGRGTVRKTNKGEVRIGFNPVMNMMTICHDTLLLVPSLFRLVSTLKSGPC